MKKINKNSSSCSLWEKLFAPFAFLTGNPTKPYSVPFMTSAPEGLSLIHTAQSPAEADLLRQVLQNEGFRVEYVPPVTTGIFGTSGSAHVFVASDQKDEASEFLCQYLGSTINESIDENPTQ